ncbi:hypothetical protein AAHA92_31717 [Salvia divinorum]|uniref:Uncharacterized protein n=1 Tax=Salvia divinorum TaxID=28513 RepID=A0ABD1FKA9_SALDI
MEPPMGLWASLWSFIRFLPFFIGLLILGVLKGIMMFPVVFLVITFGISVIILGLFPIHCFHTYYCVLSTKQFGPSLKLVLCICIPVFVIAWPPVGIACAVVGGAAYGLLAPMFATFQAIEEGKIDKFYHCIYDGICSTLKGSFTIIRDFLDVCFFSYFSIMDELRRQGPAEGKYYEIRLIYVPQALIAGVLGAVVDFPVISIIALCKSPYMLFKGWHRLFRDCIGREGPFLETICVPFAGLAILLWPLAVVGAVLGSMVSSLFLGAYAAVIVYQERSFWYGLCYIVASVSNYDEYSNDILDMPEGSCFPRPRYRERSKMPPSHTNLSASISCPSSFKTTPLRTSSIMPPMVELKPLELADALFEECQRQGEAMASKGVITLQDIENDKSGGGVLSVGLPAYCILQALLRSVKADASGILLSDNIKAGKLSEEEELFLGKLVLLSGDTVRLKSSDIGSVPKSEIRQAELDAIARRLRGITKSISRYPTFRRRFDASTKCILDELARKSEGSGKTGSRSPSLQKSKGMLGRMFSQRSSKSRSSDHGDSQENRTASERDVEIG